MEALIRWKTGNNNFIDPDYFIPIAEETGLINEIGEFVLKSVCIQGRKWLDENILRIPVSVNVSVIQLRHPDFIGKIKSIIKETDFPPGKLEIEITETILIENVGDIRSKLDQLKSLGCSIVIDDFGTKYSSFSYLKILPIDKLKIDKSFIEDISEDSKSSDIVKAIIAMGKSLKLTVITEGVETQEQIDFLKKNGCNYIQGFYYSNPVPASQIQSLLISENQNIKEGDINEV
jgi:EAL domain-containing protein (putative c-di-GMP-specific phosphodiesterase class I)